MEDFAQRWRSFWGESKAYRDHATKAMLAHLEENFDPTRAGSESTDLGGAVRIAPLLVALRNENQPTNITAAREQTMLTHAAPVMDAAEFLTRMVFLLMRGESVASALRTTAALPSETLPIETMLRKAKSTHDLPTNEAVAHLGLTCPLGKSFPAVFAILLHHGDNLETALVENVMAGGDSAARGMALGIMLVLAAQIARSELEPLKAVGGAGRMKRGRAVECYENIRTRVGAKKPNWFSVYDIYCWWRKLNRCRSKDPDVLELERKLDIACRPFRLVFEKF